MGFADALINKAKEKYAEWNAPKDSVEKKRSVGAPVAEKKEGPRRKMFETAEATEASFEHPEDNQDASFVDEETGMMVVADGVRGGADGRAISQAAVGGVAASNRISSFDINTGYSPWSLEEASFFLDGTVQESIAAVYAKKKEMTERYRADLVALKEKMAANTWPSPKEKRAMDNQFSALTRAIANEGATTFVLAQTLRTPEGWKAIVKSVGDSAGYTLKKDGRLMSIPIPDDGALMRLTESGELSPTEAEWISQASSDRGFIDTLKTHGALSDAESAFLMNELGSEGRQLAQNTIATFHSTFPENTKAAQLLGAFRDYYRGQGRGSRKVLSQAIGGSVSAEDIRVHTTYVNLEEGDTLLLASDGLDDNLTLEEIEAELAGEGDLQTKLERLKQKAIERSKDKGHLRAKPDDIVITAQTIPPDEEVLSHLPEPVQIEASRRQAEAAAK